MGVPRTAFRRSLDGLYDYLDAALPAGLVRSNNVYWVHSGTGSNSTAEGYGSFDTPFATVDYAIGVCTASRGDIILVKEGHAESLSSASAITADVAGITILGLGEGRSRPTFTFMTTATTIVISAANVTFRNMRFVAGIADVVAGFIVSAAGATIRDNVFMDSATDLNFLTPIKVTSTTDNTADGLAILRNRWLSADAASLQLLNAASTILGLRVEENFVVHEGTDSALVKFATGKLMKQASILWNYLDHKMTANELLVNNDGSTNTGIIAHNRVGHADVTSTHDLGIDALGCRLFDNLSVSTDSLSGFVLPAIDANS